MIEQRYAKNQAIASAIIELTGMIRDRYPEATFDVANGYGDDPSGTYLLATVDVEDTDDVFEIVVDRLVDLQVDEGVSVYVLLLRPLNRVAINRDNHAH